MKEQTFVETIVRWLSLLADEPWLIVVIALGLFVLITAYNRVVR